MFVNIWEFDGHDNLQVQQMFLEPEVTTVIMMDISKNLHQPLPADSLRGPSTGDLETPAEYLIFFLESINFKAIEMTIQPAISLLLTHKDEIPEHHRENYIKSYINSIHEILDGKHYAKYVTDDNIHVLGNMAQPADLIEVEDKLYGLLPSKSAWGNEIPARWSQLEADIRDRFQSSTIIQTDIVTMMASAYGMHEDEVESFLEFHHSAGNWITCPADGTVITDPQWLLNILQSLFKNSEIQSKAGLVSEEDLHILWKGEDVPALVNLISNLQFMTPIQSQNEKTFLIPSLLPTSTELQGMCNPPDKMNKVYESLYTVAGTRKICLDTYHKLICILGNETDWKIQSNKLSYLNACFAVTESITLALTLIESQIQLTAWSDKGVAYKDLQTNLQYIWKILAGLFQKCEIPENDFFQMLCPHSKVGDECLVKVNVSKNPEDHEIIWLPEEHKCPVHNEYLSPKDFKQFQLENQEREVKIGRLLKSLLEHPEMKGKKSKIVLNNLLTLTDKNI